MHVCVCVCVSPLSTYCVLCLWNCVLVCEQYMTRPRETNPLHVLWVWHRPALSLFYMCCVASQQFCNYKPEFWE